MSDFSPSGGGSFNYFPLSSPPSPNQPMMPFLDFLGTLLFLFRLDVDSSFSLTFLLRLLGDLFSPYVLGRVFPLTTSFSSSPLSPTFFSPLLLGRESN